VRMCGAEMPSPPSVTIKLLAHMHACMAPNKKESTMAPTSKKKAAQCAARPTDKLPGNPPAASISLPTNNIGVSTEEADEAAVFREIFLKNLKSKIPDPDKRPLVLFLKQKNITKGEGWLRKALFPNAVRLLSDSEKGQILLLSASLIGTTDSTKIIAHAWALSDRSIRNTWNADLLSPSSSSCCTAQAADKRLASAFNITPDLESQPQAGTNAEETRQSATTDRNSKKRKCNDSE
jgi:hypothetical protein